MNLKTPEAMLALALDIITPRVMTMTAMVFMLGIAAWVLYQPDTMRLAVLAIWGIFVFLPVVKLETQQKETQS